MQTVTTVVGLTGAIREYAVGSTALVAIDGVTTSGKSTLSRELAGILGASHIEVDSFLVRQQGEYVAHLRLDELSKRIERDQSHGQIVLFDAVCALAALDRLGRKPDIHVYVTRLDSRGDWFDGEIFTSGLSESEAIASEESLVAPFGGELTELRREVMRYHFAHRPWERADILYTTIDAREA